MTAVLVAEDDQDIRELIAFILEINGYTVLEAADGETALALARGEQPDVLLLDIRMPAMSGVQVCRRLKADPATAELPVMMLTACAADTDIAMGMSAGADEYVVKPFSPRELIGKVRATLAHSRGHRRMSWPVALPS